MDKKKRKKKRWLVVAVVGLAVLLIAAFIYTPALPEVAKIADQMENVDGDRKSTRLNSSHANESRMPSSA